MNTKYLSRRLRTLAHRMRAPVAFVRQISAPLDDLTILANRVGSDKGDRNLDQHCYTRIYSRLFGPLRQERIRLLEIGLLHHKNPAWRNVVARFLGGAKASRAPSLEMWLEYFPEAMIFGFDINDFSDVRLDRCRIVRGDMGLREDLGRLIRDTGGDFDIIIDDASHASHHQQTALGSLFPFLRPGGMYIIEDLSFQPPGIEVADVPRTLDLLRRTAVTGSFDSPCLTGQERKYFEETLESIALFDSLLPYDPIAAADALAVLRKRRE